MTKEIDSKIIPFPTRDRNWMPVEEQGTNVTHLVDMGPMVNNDPSDMVQYFPETNNVIELEEYVHRKEVIRE